MPNNSLTRDDALARDAANSLLAYRDRFVIDEPDLIYLDGNSLGRLPKRAAEIVRESVAEQWGRRLIRSWREGWFEAAEVLGEKVSPLIGAAPGQTIYADSTSVNLYKLALAALARPQPRATPRAAGRTPRSRTRTRTASLRRVL